jgi:hypothetical protein
LDLLQISNEDMKIVKVLPAFMGSGTDFREHPVPQMPQAVVRRAEVVRSPSE